MSTLTDVLVIIGLFTLRIGVPLAVIAGLACLLKRLDRRWEEEGRMQTGAIGPVAQPLDQPEQRPEVPQPASQPSVPVQQPPLEAEQAWRPPLTGSGNGDGRS